MLEVLGFIFKCVGQFISMLFNVNMGGGFSLGLLMCIFFIFLPITLAFLTFLKNFYQNEVTSDIKSSLRSDRGNKKRRYR